MKYVIGGALAFGGPFVAGMNAAILWGQPGYDAQPWKVLLAMALSALGLVLLTGREDQ